MADILCLSSDDVFDQIVPDPECSLDLKLDSVDCLNGEIKNMFSTRNYAELPSSQVTMLINMPFYFKYFI